MTIAAVPNIGAQLWMAKHGQALVRVSELVSLKTPNPSHSILDVTTHDSPADAAGGVPMEKIKEVVYDPGQASGTINYVAGSANDDAWIEGRDGPDLYDFKFVVPTTGGATEQMLCSGYILAYEPQDKPVRGVQVANFTIEITGVITQSAVA